MNAVARHRKSDVRRTVRPRHGRERDERVRGVLVPAVAQHEGRVPVNGREVDLVVLTQALERHLLEGRPAICTAPRHLHAAAAQKRPRPCAWAAALPPWQRSSQPAHAEGGRGSFELRGLS